MILKPYMKFSDSMKAMIIEDEYMAREHLAETLLNLFPDIEIVRKTGSVKESVEWLKSHKKDTDLIFMDVVLVDGYCFEIFNLTEIQCHVIITTAYDKYALKAFENNCVDYILKPIQEEALKRAVERCMLKKENTDIDNLIRALTTKTREYKDRILVHNDGYILPVSINNVSYFISESKDSFVVVKNGTRYSLDKSLDNIMSDLDPERFFRISRSIIISKDIVSKITKSPNGQLVLSASCQSGDSDNKVNIDFIVSRARSKDFMLWIGE